MLSIASIKASPAVAARYYTEGDYYTKDGDEPSEWGGSGAAQLGLEGSVDAGTFKALLGGSLPEGHSAGWGKSNKEHHSGWDLTFSAPKGVSIMAIVGGDSRLIDAHMKAVKEALAFAETYAHVRERLEDGSMQVKPTNSLVAAQFTEFFSRASDPQLHTHCPIMNATYDKDRDAWYALHSEPLYAMKMATGQVYRNALALRTKQLGYETSAARDTGLFDLKNIPQQLLEDYSQRSAAIRDYATQHDWKSAAQFAKATLLTRPDKTKSDHSRLVEDLRLRADEYLPHIEALKTGALEAAKTVTVEPELSKEAAEHAVKHLATREAVFEHGNLIKEALKVSIGATDRAHIETALQRLDGRHKIQTTDFQTGGNHIYHGRTINQSLAWEAKVGEAIIKTRDQVWSLASAATVEQALTRSKLTDEQKEAASFVLRSRDRAIAVIGVAGSGKSHLIRTLKEATPSRNYMALAPTATAAFDLGKSAGIEAKTLQKFLETGGKGVGRNSVLIVDEASMTSTRQALRLLSIASARKARVVFVGDTKQFDAIDQGKPLALLMDQGLRGPFIGTSFRQKNEAMRTLVAEARKGNIDGVLHMLGPRLHELDASELAKHVAEAWHTNPNRDSIQMAALDNSSRIALNGEIRELLQGEGKVDKHDHAFSVLSSKALTGAQLRIADYYKKDDVLVFHTGQRALGIAPDERFKVSTTGHKSVKLQNVKSGERIRFEPSKHSLRGASLYQEQDRKLAVGDRIQWRKNQRDDKSVQNGHTGKVKEIRGDHAQIEFDHGLKRSLNLSEHPYWDHGYALTVYKQQGKTTPINWVIANTSRVGQIDQKTLYVSLTRAERSVSLFTDDKSKFENAVKNNPGGKTSSLEARGALVNFRGSAKGQQQTFTEKLLDRLPDHFRTLGTNIVDIARENGGRDTSKPSTKSTELARLSAIREAAEAKPEPVQSEQGEDRSR